MKSNLKELTTRHASNGEGDRFQKEFAAFIASKGAKTIVETGSGISTLFLLNALSKDAKVYSIDPEPWCGFEVSHPNYKLIKKMSTHAMVPLFKETGLWDVLLHDSNHDILVQTYELDMAYACVKPGGIIACDDYTWGGHKAWDDFCKRYNFEPKQLGNIQYVEKDMSNHYIVDGKIDKYHANSLSFAKEREEIWLSKGNKNTDVFLDWRV